MPKTKAKTTTKSKSVLFWILRVNDETIFFPGTFKPKHATRRQATYGPNFFFYVQEVENHVKSLWSFCDEEFQKAFPNAPKPRVNTPTRVRVTISLAPTK